MHEQENVWLARQAYQEFIDGDIESILIRTTEDTLWFYPGPPDQVPYSGVFQGREEVARFFARLNETLDLSSFEARDFVPYGDRVIVIGHQTGIVRATGTRFEEDWVHICTYRNGKLARWHAFIDTGSLLADLRLAKAHAV